MNIRDRIVQLKRIRAKDLRANPNNWRTHPEEQRGGLSAMLQDIGFVGAILAREMDDGTLEILDGHLRADIADDAKVPVLITDLNDEEAAKHLLTYDPLSAAAKADVAALEKLVGATKLPDHADLRKLVADLEFNKARESSSSSSSEQTVEGMELRPHEHYDYVVVLATTNQEWNALCDRLGLRRVARNRRRRSIGLGRAIRASTLLELLPSPKRTKK